jgi:hypothetical protein
VIHGGVLVLVEHHLDAVGGDFVDIAVTLGVHVHGDVLAGFGVLDGVVALVVVVDAGFYVQFGEMGQFAVPHQLRHVLGGGEALQVARGDFAAEFVVDVDQPVAALLGHRHDVGLRVTVGRAEGLKLRTISQKFSGKAFRTPTLRLLQPMCFTPGKHKLGSQ